MLFICSFFCSRPDRASTGVSHSSAKEMLASSEKQKNATTRTKRVFLDCLISMIVCYLFHTNPTSLYPIVSISPLCLSQKDFSSMEYGDDTDHTLEMVRQSFL